MHYRHRNVLVVTIRSYIKHTNKYSLKSAMCYKHNIRSCEVSEYGLFIVVRSCSEKESRRRTPSQIKSHTFIKFFKSWRIRLRGFTLQMSKTLPTHGTISRGRAHWVKRISELLQCLDWTGPVVPGSRWFTSTRSLPPTALCWLAKPSPNKAAHTHTHNICFLLPCSRITFTIHTDNRKSLEKNV